jgi:hypothetical protein
MPILKLGERDDWIGIRLYTFMAHPNDERNRTEYLAWLKVQAALANAKRIEKLSGNKKLEFQLNAYDELKTLIKAPSYKEVIERGERSIKEASIAGEILYIICTYHHFYKTNKVGVNKAIWLIEDSMNRRRSTALKVVKRTKILKYWKEYKSVAHFWCALKLLSSILKIKGYPDCKLLQKKHQALNLIAVAEEIRRFGENFSWHTGMPPVLLKGKCLRLPKSFPLPKISIEKWPKPSPRQKKFLTKNFPSLKNFI